MGLIEELEARIADLRARLPKHSVQPAMLEELEDLEIELERALAAEKNGDDAADPGPKQAGA